MKSITTVFAFPRVITRRTHCRARWCFCTRDGDIKDTSRVKYVGVLRWRKYAHIILSTRGKYQSLLSIRKLCIARWNVVKITRAVCISFKRRWMTERSLSFPVYLATYSPLSIFVTTSRSLRTILCLIPDLSGAFAIFTLCWSTRAHRVGQYFKYIYLR